MGHSYQLKLDHYYTLHQPPSIRFEASVMDVLVCMNCKDFGNKSALKRGHAMEYILQIQLNNESSTYTVF